MRNTKRSGGFFLCLILNMLISILGIIPAAVLLVLHFWLKISLWWSVIAFAIWVLCVVLWTAVMYLANRYGAVEDVPKENKNPYSVVNEKNEP